MFGAISNKDLEIIDSYFTQFIKFISYEKSEFDYIESTGNSKVDSMLKKWNEEIRTVDYRNKDDMKVLGEIVLTADKVEQGINMVVECLKTIIDTFINYRDNIIFLLESICLTIFRELGNCFGK